MFRQGCVAAQAATRRSVANCLHAACAAPGLRSELRNTVLAFLFYGFVSDQGCQRAWPLPELLEKPDCGRLPGQKLLAPLSLPPGDSEQRKAQEFPFRE